MTRDSDTHLQGGDAQQAPFMGSAGRETASPEPGRTTHIRDELASHELAAWRDYEPPATAGSQTHRATMLQRHAFVMGMRAALKASPTTQADNVLREALEAICLWATGGTGHSDKQIVAMVHERSFAALKAPTTEPNPEGMKVAEAGYYTPWCKMADAPRDGTEVLLLADGQAIQAAYDPEDFTWFNGRFGLGFGAEYGGDPTAWRPLPPLPALTDTPEHDQEKG